MATKKYVSTSNLTSFLDNLKSLFATKTEINAKSDKIHTHAISDVSGLQTELNNKALSSHGTHVTYSATAPLMDGTASVGTASTISRSDHRHPTDTSRAAQTSLDSHASNTTVHITSSERTNWGTSYSHSQSAHAPSNAEKNQNAFSNVVVGSTTIAADSTTDTLTLVAGSNITITPDATNDKITIAAKDTTYSLSSFGITATAAELNKLDGVTATATEINYIDGVTSSIQTQLDGKAASGHTHTIANVSGLQSALDGKSANNHTHNYAGSSSAGGAADALAVFDTRNINETPTEMTNKIGSRGIRFDFKGTSTVGLNNGTYAAVMSVSPWGDVTNWSGGKNTQLGFCDDGKIQVRKGNGSGWTDWNTLIDSSTIGSQSVNYATSAGSATKATKDASGNTITSTYATKTELDTAKSTLQTSINGKANSSHSHTIANITNLQTTLDAKASSSHTHNYAGSSSAGGAATSANKLNTNAGSATQPVYFANGIPVATTYTLGKSVPSNAVFTDTNTKVTNTLATTTKAYVTGTTSASTNTGTQVFDTGVYLDTAAGQLTATTFNGTTFSGSGVATIAEVKTYLGI